MDVNSSMTIVESNGCGCAACQSGVESPYFNSNGEIDIDSPNDAPTVYGTAQQMADQLISGYWTNSTPGTTTRNWTKTNITFSFGNNGYTNAEEQAFRDSFELWSDVTNLTFTEVGSGGDINILEGGDGRAYSSSSYYVGSGNIVSNTISIDTDTGSWNNLSGLGAYGFTTILHEIGHSLGLGHQGNYNGSVNYNDPSQVQFLNDNDQYSIMSYNDASLLGTDHWAGNGQWQYAVTPMLYDIMAIQQKYGANTSIRSGNTTYGFNSNAGRDVYDLTLHSGPFAIWDGGGIDTLDLSGYSTNQTIRLGQGEFSDAGHMTNNIVIAYNAVIENAIGGSGNDSIYGNSSNNVLTGNNGNDTIYASTGSDTLNGGQGTDTANYSSYNIADFLITLVDSVTLSLQHIADSWTDTVSNFENFIFSNNSYTWNEIQSEVTNLDPVTVRVNWTGGFYLGSFDSGDDITLSAADMSHPNANGNLLRVDRDINSTTISVLSEDLSNSFFAYGTGSNDTIRIQGTHSNFGARVYGGDGNDTVTMIMSSADRIYGEGGNDIISAGDGNDFVYGGTGDDTVSGGNGTDTIYGMDDNDILSGNGGDDVIYGGAGDDQINGGSNNDVLYGDAGVDTINGGNGNDWIEGGSEGDILNGDGGNDRIYGQGGNDTINGGASTDYLYGGDGIDTINGGDGGDSIQGEDGNDILNGEAGQDIIFGGAGNDTITGGTDTDRLYGGTGNDDIDGGSGRDFLYGGDNDDIIRGGASVDRLYGDETDGSGVAGNDTLYGDGENDFLYGFGGNDTLYGGSENDRLYGNSGDDRLEGGTGNDRLYGNEDSDILIGGAGADILEGGSGGDTFGFTSLDGSFDLITDFTMNGADRDAINITDLLSGYTPGSSDINDFVTLVYFHGNRTELYVNADGAGNDWVNIVKVQGSSFNGLSAGDLLTNGNLVADETLL